MSIVTVKSRKALSLAGKELYSCLWSPVFYGIAVFFLLFTGVWLFYFQRYFTLNQASLRPWFAAFPLAFVLVIPVITMRSWAEEWKTGTAELLLSMPFSEWDLVLGKYLSAMGIVTALLVLTLPLPFTLSGLGNYDAGVIAGEYLGALLLASSSVSLGNLLSSLAKNQGGAFLGCAAVLLVVTMLAQITQSLSLPPALAGFLSFFSLAFHFESFSRGLLDSRDLAFFILSTALFLYLNTQTLLYRKWR
ncbi:MAG: ABC transporter permease subunit [Spirochaetaceae bacterium]|jgi:ABC-2 type transport system permease protein|nr:ABC transporter permease subunit [Spirochaetaceae bacterium]